MTMTPPPWPAAPPATQPHRRSPVLLAVLAVLLAVAALIVAIVALIRLPATPNYTAAQRAEAKAELCDRFKPAMDAVHIETNGSDAALGRIALTNGAVVLQGASANPALDSKYRDAAQAVIQAYENLVIESSSGRSGDAKFDGAVNAVNAKEQVLKDMCGD
ncbi:hypothetical protein [Mycolicibacter kumamotonensis]|nr:hypothetical protein [Mycolicibacter kumamotonensis]